MEKLRDATLVFLIKKSEGKITDICLGLKKRGFATGKYNGVGGKVENNETIEQAAIRETQEEINIIPKQLVKVGEFTFYYASNSDWDQLVHVYITEEWAGEPEETEEIKPAWFTPETLPFAQMWPDDKFWMPYFLTNRSIKAVFNFDENNQITEKNIQVVEGF